MPYRENKTNDVKRVLRATYYLGHSRTIAVTALTLTTPPHFLSQGDIQEQFRHAE